MGYRLHRLDDPVFTAGPKPMLTEFGIDQRLESCEWLQNHQRNQYVMNYCFWVKAWLTLSILLESKIEPELILPNKSALWWVLASSRCVWGCEADSRPVGTTPGRRRQEEASTHWCRGTPNTGPPPLIPSLVLSDMAWRKIEKMVKAVSQMELLRGLVQRTSTHFRPYSTPPPPLSTFHPL